MKEELFDWFFFYKAFARRLLAYKDNRRELIAIIRKIYENIGLSLPTLGKDGDIEDVDPFTVFGLFNKQPMKESNRKKIVSEIGKLFGIDAPTPTSFASIPVLNALNAIFFYYQSEQAEQEVDNLWGLFESALAYADSATSKLRDKVSHHFNQALNIKGTASSKITMGLYWIAPDAFLSLDSRNKWFIFESGEIPEDFVKSLPRFESKITAQKYFEIVEKTLDYLRSGASDLKDFKELSYKAWQLSKDSKDGEEPVKKVRYWVYAPGDNACKWDEFFDKGIMGIGWEELGDLKQYHSKTEIKEKMKESFGSDSSHANSALATWQFANELKPGDVVTANPYFNCGTCYSCQRGHVNCCHDNQTMGVQRDGSFCEYVAMPVERIYPGQGLTPDQLALIEPFSIGYHALSRCEVKPGDKVLVIGAGPIGLFALISAKSRGAEVYSADLLDGRLEKAKAFGADGVINSGKESLADYTAKVAEGGFDVCVEACGAPETFLSCIDCCAFAGNLILIGNGKRETTFLHSTLLKKELNVYGSRNSLPKDFRELIGLVADGTADPLPMVSAVYDFEHAADAFDALVHNDGSLAKVLIRFAE